ALNGHRELRLPNTLNVRFPRAVGATVLAHAPGVAASTASACHSGVVRASPVIVAMGIAPEQALSSIRLSLGRGPTRQDVEDAARMLIAAWHAATAQPRIQAMTRAV